MEIPKLNFSNEIKVGNLKMKKHERKRLPKQTGGKKGIREQIYKHCIENSLSDLIFFSIWKQIYPLAAELTFPSFSILCKQLTPIHPNAVREILSPKNFIRSSRPEI